MSEKILVVDDEPAIVDAVAYALRASGFEVDTSGDGESALEAARSNGYDVLVLDVRLPGLSGLEICRRLREESDVPILILTAMDAEVDRVLGLEAGADDYVTKPFGLAELRSRIRAVLRRAGPRALGDEVLSVGPITLDRTQRIVKRDGEPVGLTFSEFELLNALMSDPGRLFSREELLRAIWGDSAYRDPRAIDVHIRHLREKLEEQPERPQLILTVRGAGYRLQPV